MGRRWMVLAAALQGLAAAFALAERDLREEMRGLARDLRVVMPLVYAPDPELDGRQRQRLAGAVASMRGHLAAVEEVLDATPVGRISAAALAGQLARVEVELEAGRDARALDLLHGALAGCVSCHSRDGLTARFADPGRRALRDPWVEAEYLFLTRRYEEARRAFLRWLEAQPQLAYDDRTLTAFERLLTAGILVRRAPGAVMADLDRFIRAPGTHPMLRNHLVAWREGVAELARQRDLRSHPDPAALRALAARWLETTPNERLAHVYLPENARPRLLWLRAELSRAFEEEGDRRRAAEWLYLLAVADRLLEYRFFPLADLYLAECVLSYADTPAAPVCLREYEAYVEFFYTGSAGTAVPPEVAAQLARLRRHLEGARPRASQPASQGVRP